MKRALGRGAYVVQTLRELGRYSFPPIHYVDANGQTQTWQFDTATPLPAGDIGYDWTATPVDNSTLQLRQTSPYDPLRQNYGDAVDLASGGFKPMSVLASGSIPMNGVFPFMAYPPINDLVAMDYASAHSFDKIHSNIALAGGSYVVTGTGADKVVAAGSSEITLDFSQAYPDSLTSRSTK